MRHLLSALGISFLVAASIRVVDASLPSCASGSQLLQVKQTGRGHQRALLETAIREATGNGTDPTSSPVEDHMQSNEVIAEDPLQVNETDAIAEDPVQVNETDAIAEDPVQVNETDVVVEDPVQVNETDVVVEDPVQVNETDVVVEDPVQVNETDVVVEETITINETSAATTAAPINTTAAATTPIGSINTTAAQATVVNSTLLLTTTGFPVVVTSTEAAAQVIPVVAVGPPVPAIVEWQPSPLWAPAPAPMIPVVPGQVIPPAGEPEEAQPAMVPVIPVARTEVIPTIVVPNVDCNGPESQTFNNVTVNIAGDQIIYDGSAKEPPSAPSSPFATTVNKTEAPPQPVTAAPVTVVATTAAPAVPKYVTFEFQPGRLGLEADWTSGNITGVDEKGQGAEKGIEKGWVITEVDDVPYTEAVLDDHIQGKANYNMTFQTLPDMAGEAPPIANLYLKEEHSRLSRGAQK